MRGWKESAREAKSDCRGERAAAEAEAAAPLLPPTPDGTPAAPAATCEGGEMRPWLCERWSADAAASNFAFDAEPIGAEEGTNYVLKTALP